MCIAVAVTSVCNRTSWFTKRGRAPEKIQISLVQAACFRHGTSAYVSPCGPEQSRDQRREREKTHPTGGGGGGGLLYCTASPRVVPTLVGESRRKRCVSLLWGFVRFSLWFVPGLSGSSWGGAPLEGKGRSPMYLTFYTESLIFRRIPGASLNCCRG